MARRIEVLGKGQTVLPALALLADGKGTTAKEIGVQLVAQLEGLGVKYTEKERGQIIGSVYNIVKHRESGGVSNFFEFDTTKRPYKWSMNDAGRTLLDNCKGTLSLLANLEFEAYNEAVKRLDLAQRDPMEKGSYDKEGFEGDTFEVEPDNFIYNIKEQEDVLVDVLTEDDAPLEYDQDTPLDILKTEMELLGIGNLHFDTTYRDAEKRLFQYKDNVAHIVRYGLDKYAINPWDLSMEVTHCEKASDLFKGKGDAANASFEMRFAECLRRYLKGSSSFTLWHDNNVVLMYKKLAKLMYDDKEYKAETVVGQNLLDKVRGFQEYIETFNDVEWALDQGFYTEYCHENGLPKALVNKFHYDLTTPITDLPASEQEALNKIGEKIQNAIHAEKPAQPKLTLWQRILKFFGLA